MSAILFREFPLPHLDPLAALVSQVYGMTDCDARAKIRRGWGFLEHDIPAADAGRLVTALSPWAMAIDDAQLKQPADPVVIHGYTADGANFTVQPSGEIIPWRDVSVRAVGGVTEDVVHREASGGGLPAGRMLMGLGIFAVTGLPLGVLGRGRSTKEAKPMKKTNWITFVRIIIADGRQFAFQPDHFDFAALGANKQLNSAGNLRAMLVEWQQRTTARFNWGASLMLENKSLFSANYQSVRDFETELLWICNVLHA